MAPSSPCGGAEGGVKHRRRPGWRGRKRFAPVRRPPGSRSIPRGRMVPAQRPVLSIMTRRQHEACAFFVPETTCQKLRSATRVRVTCDACAADLTARILFHRDIGNIPPVISRLDERTSSSSDQARPSRPVLWRVGQPIRPLNARIRPRYVEDKRWPTIQAMRSESRVYQNRSGAAVVTGPVG